MLKNIAVSLILLALEDEDVRKKVHGIIKDMARRYG